MKYSNAISAALGGLFRTQIAQPQGNGTLDAMKLAEGESSIAKNRAGIGRDEAETNKINKRLQDMYDPAFQEKIAQGLLPDAQPQQRASAILSALRLTDNPERITTAYDDSMNQGYFNQALNNPEFAKQFNTANAAKGGKLYDAVGSTGMTLSQADGGQFVGNKEQFGNNQAKTISETGKNNAQTEQAKAETMLKRAETKLKQQGLDTSGLSVESNSDGGFVVVDKLKATGRPVVMPNTGQPTQPITKKTPWSSLPPKQANQMKQKVRAQAEAQLAEEREYLLRARAARNDMRRFGELNREFASGGLENKIPWTFDAKGQEMEAITARLAPNQRPQGSGATSDFDAKMYLRGVPSRDKAAETNKNIREYAEEQYNKLTYEMDFKENYLLENGYLPSRKEIESHVENMRLVNYLDSANIQTQEQFNRVTNALRKQGWSNRQILTASEQLGL